MRKSTKIILLSITVCMSVLIILGTIFFMNGWSVPVTVIFYSIAGAGIITETLALIFKKQAIFKSAFILVVFVFIIAAVFMALSTVGNLGEYPTDEQKINKLVEMIKATGVWSKLVFVIIQVLQVTILPLPAAVCYIPGSQIWGAMTATILASIGVIIGSMIDYVIGKFFGKKIVIWIAGKETTEKYSKIIGNRGKFIFALMQILPFFPDDILCMVAGLTSMSFIFFTVTIVLIRPLIIAAYCFLGSGNIIPFSGWGIPVWIAIFAVCIILAVLSFKYQDRIEKWIVSKFRRNNKSENK